MLININFEQIERLTESMNQIVAENKKLQSDKVIVKNVNRKLEEQIVYLAKKSGEGGAIQPQKERGDVRDTKQHS